MRRAISPLCSLLAPGAVAGALVSAMPADAQGGLCTTLRSFPSALVGVFGFSAASRGFLLAETTLPERLALFAAAAILVTFGPVTDLLGPGLPAAVAPLERRRALAAAPSASRTAA